MIHINRNFPVPKAFTSIPIKNDIKKYKEYYKRSVKSRSQESFGDSINGDTQETLEAVARQFKYKCAACEQSLSIRNIISDSWRPRHNAKGFKDEFSQDHYWWLSYVWDNKYALCANCNKFKGTWFPVEGIRAPIKTPYSIVIKKEKALLIDPCHDYPEEHLIARENGKLACLTKKGEATIELLKLNRQELIIARLKIIKVVSKHLKETEMLWRNAKNHKGSLSPESLILKKMLAQYSMFTSWLEDHPETDFVMVRRQLLVTWLYLKPEFHNFQTFKNFFSRKSDLHFLREFEKIFVSFQRLFVNKPRAVLTFKPFAIVKPNTSFISKNVIAKTDQKPVASPKKPVGKKEPNKTGTAPVNTLSTLITEGLKIVDTIADNPFVGGVLNSLASAVEKVSLEEKLVRLYPEKIEIKNFKSISNLSFDFKVPAAETKLLGISLMSHKEPWKFLLGENGVGKSSILQAIALVLAGEKYINKLKLDPTDFLKHGTKSGSVKISFVGVKEPAVLKITSKKITCNFSTDTVNVLAYGSTRLMPKENTSLQPEESVSRVKIKNLFDYSVSLSDVKKWMLAIDQASFDKVCKALKDVLDLPAVNTYFIRENNEVYFSVHKETLDQLSEGYRSVLALAVDIMKSLSEDNGSSKKVTNSLTYEVIEGIVLIDEISSHLHPRWQMKIVKAFRKAFPKLQFIVTSHDPLSLKGIENGEVLLLKRDAEQNVIGIGNLPDPTEFRAEQLLTSEFFGLSSTLDPDLEIQFNTYHYLLAKEILSPDEKKQLQTLKESLKDKKHLGDSLREEIMYDVIDSSLARYANTIETTDRKELFDSTKNTVFNLWDKLYKK